MIDVPCEYMHIRTYMYVYVLWKSKPICVHFGYYCALLWYIDPANLLLVCLYILTLFTQITAVISYTKWLFMQLYVLINFTCIYLCIIMNYTYM